MLIRVTEVHNRHPQSQETLTPFLLNTNHVSYIKPYQYDRNPAARSIAVSPRYADRAEETILLAETCTHIEDLLKQSPE